MSSAAPELSDLGERLRKKREERALRQAQDGAAVAAPLDAKTVGRARELSASSGLPQETVERNLPAVEQQEAARALPWDEIAQSKELQRYLADPQRAAVVRDDVPQMLGFRRALLGEGAVQALPQPQAPPEPGLFEVLGNRFESGRRTAVEVPAAATPLIWGALTGQPVTFEQRRAWRELRARPLGPTRRAGALDDILGAPLEQLPILGALGASSLAGGAAGAGPGAAIGAGVGSLAGGVGAGPGALAGAGTGFALGAKTGAAAGAFFVEAGNAFAEFEGLTGADGQPLDEQTIAAGAVAVGAINAGLELVGFQALAKRIPGLDKLLGKGREVVSANVVRQMRNPALRTALLAAARETLAAVGAEVGTELAQETVNIEAGRVLTGEGVGLDSEDVGRLGETAVQTALGVLPLVGVGQGVRVKLDRMAQAQQNAAQLQLAQQAVAQAQSRELSPQAFGELTEALAREAGIEEVRIPARELLERFAGGEAELAAAVPEVADQLTDALALGGDLAVPVGRYFGTLDAQFGADLIQDVRLRPEDMTVREAALAEAELPAQLEQELALEMAVAERAAPPAAALEGEAAAEPAPAAPHDWAVQALRKAKTQTQVAEVLALVRAQDSLGLQAPLFADPAGVLSGTEFADYTAALAAARGKAQEKLAGELSAEARHKAAALRAEDRTFARVRADFEREVTAEVDRSPVEQARGFLRLRVDSDATPQQRLDRDVLREYGKSPYGKDWADAVPRGMVQVGGLHPDLVAELFGYSSGLELVNALVSAPAREQAIADGVEARMLARFGDQEATRVEAAVLDAAQNDEQFRVLQIEERALARLVGGRPVDRRTVKLAAERLIAKRRVKDVRPQAYRDQARRAALAAVEAVGQKDYETAREHKRSQILNLALEQEARAVEREVEKGSRTLAKYARKKSTRERLAKAGQGEYLRQIDALLERHGLRQVIDADRRPVAEWVRELEEGGAEVVLSDRLRDERQRAPAGELSVADWRDLRDAVANLAELAKRESEIATRAEKAQLETVEAKIVEAIEAQGFKAKGPVGFTETTLERVRARARGIDASLRKAEFVIDALSGDDPNSMLRRFVWEPLRDAQSNYNAKLAEYSEKLAALRRARGDDVVASWGKSLPETRLRKPDGSPYPMTKWNAIMIALNLGNASNTEKLLRGYGWDQATVDAVLADHLDAADWQFVQGVWDLIDQLWPDIAKMERRMTGVTPPRVEAQTVRTRFGDFRGGYFPVVYDPNRSRLGQRQEANAIVPGPSEGFTRATTGHGHTRERTKVVGPLLLDPNVIASHMDQVILDLTHREALIDAQRVLARPGVDGAITKALGREFGFRDFWAPRLRAVARDTADVRGLSAWYRSARWVRQRGTVAKLGFRATTLIMQASGHSNGLRVIQQMGGTTGDWMRGVWEGMGGFDPQRARKTYEQVYEASPFMRDRAKSSQQEVRELLRERGAASKASSKVADFALELIGQVQLRTVDMPIWLAAHRVASAQGMTEERAVRAADAAVSKSQGGGTKLDQSAFEQNDLLRLLTPFYSYSNTVYNQLFRKGDIGAKRLADYALFILAPGLYAAAISAATSGDFPDPDDRDYEKKLAKALAKAAVGDVAAGVPFVRDVWTVPLGERSRAAAPLELFTREGADLLDPKDGAEFMFDALRAAGLVAGVPVGAPARALEAAIRGE